VPPHLEISPSDLAGLTGLATAPDIVDVRIDEDFDADPRILPAARRRSHASASAWAAEYAGRSLVVVCQKGLKLSHGTAALLRHAGVKAVALGGGFEAWRDGDGLLVRTASLPPSDEAGRTVWVTRTRPKVDRIACPWLIRRFVDARAVFLFVPAGEVAAVAERFGAAAFDVEGAFWGHRGDRCTFDAIIAELDLRSEALDHLATIVRAADTSRPELAPEAAGLLAASRGLSLLCDDDLEQLAAGMTLYDALYRWCVDAAAAARAPSVQALSA